MVRATTESMGIRSILEDVGIETQIRVHGGASAAIGITKRLGLGKVRHLSVRDLWLQENNEMGQHASRLT